MQNQHNTPGVFDRVRSSVPEPVKRVLRGLLKRSRGQDEDPWACAAQSLDNEWTFRVGQRVLRCFFLCGGWKSGTHWVERLIRLHPRACMGGEFHFESLVDGYATFVGRPGRLGHHSQKLKRISRHSLYSCVRRCLYAHLHPIIEAHPRVEWIGDRSPRRLRAVLPGAPHILLLRDGRDVLVSRAYHVLRANRPEVMLRPSFSAMVEKWGPVFAAAPEQFVDPEIGPLAHEEWVRFTIRGWADDMLHDLANRDRLVSEGTPVYSIGYEDLHDDLESRRAEMYEFLGLDPAEARPPCHQSKTKPGFERVDLKSATRKGQTGDWKNHFNDRLTRIFKEEAGEALIQAGYEKSLNWSSQ